MNEQIYDSVIVGSGPAGLTAAIYNIRANLKTLVLSGNQPGGQLTITTVVENFPGFPEGVGGLKLMMDTIQQVKNLGGEMVNENVIKIINEGQANSLSVQLDSGKIIKTKTVIIATGARARWLDVGEKEFIGRGVSGCATCDGMFFKDKIIAVVGGGDVACTEAEFLTKFAKKVYLIHRRDQLRAIEAEQKKVLNNSKIEMWWNTEVIGVEGQGKLQNIKIKNNKTGEEKTVPIEGLFVAIGHDPATEFVGDLVARSETGHINIKGGREYHTMTNVGGIFAAGDCVDENYRQAIIAAGMGAMAALDCQKWIDNN